MFIDECGNEFKTVEEIEDFARKEFYNQDENRFKEVLEDYFLTEDIFKWIFRNDKEKFIKDHKRIFKGAEDDFISDYFIIHDIEEV